MMEYTRVQAMWAKSCGSCAGGRPGRHAPLQAKCRSSSKDTVHRYLLAICTTQCKINCSTRPQHGASSPFPFYPSHNLRARHFQVPKSCAPVWGLKAFFRRLVVWRETILGQLVNTVVKKSHRCCEMWRGNKRRYNGKLGFIFQPEPLQLIASVLPWVPNRATKAAIVRGSH